MPKDNVVDIDSIIAPMLEKNITAANTAEIRLNGTVFHLRASGSVIGLIESMGGTEESGAAFIDWLAAMVIPDQRQEFRILLRRIDGNDGEVLAEIANAMTEALADRPTEPSSPKRASSRKLTSVTPSTDGSPSEESPDYVSGDGLTL